MDAVAQPRDDAERRLRLLTAGAGVVANARCLRDVLPRLLDLARDALHADAYAIWRRDPAARRWAVLAQSGLSARYVEATTARLADGVVPTHEPIVIEDADASPLLHAHRPAQREEGIQSLLVVPLVLHGEPSGTLAFYSRARRRFAQADVDAGSLAATLAAGAIANAELYEARAKSEERYRFLAEHANDVVARVSPAGVFLDVSPAVRRILGYEPEDLIGRKAADHIHPDDHARLRAAGPSAVDGAATPVRYRHRDGRWVQMEAATRVARDEQGGVAEFVTSLRDVTQQAAHERDLRLHARVLESMVEGVSLASPEGVIVYTNPAEDAMFGYARGELVGKHVTVQNAYPPEENARLVSSIIEQLRTRGLWEGEFRNVRKDGTHFTTHARITSVTLDGQAHWLCVQEDVTLRKQLEARERESARRLSTLKRVQEELARDLDLERVVQTATDAVTSLTGASFGAFFYNVHDARGGRYTLYTLSGAPREAFAGFPMPRSTEVFAPTFRGEGIVRSDDVTKDPRYGKNAPHHGMPPGHLPVRSYLAVPVLSGTGTVHGGFFLGHPQPGVFTKESEELAAGIAAQAAIALDNAFLYRQAKENERRLMESEARFRTLVTAATQMVWSTDADGMIVDMPEWRAFTGQTPEEVRGTGWVAAVHPEDRPRVIESWRDAFARRAVYEAEYRVRSRAGDYRHFLARAVPRTDASGALIEYIGTWTDVTPQKEALQEAEALRTKLIQGEKLAALGSLVSGVAHELRTPLTFLSNNAFLLQYRLEAAAKVGMPADEVLALARPFLHEVTAGVDRINQLVEDLRRYTKARHDQQPVRASVHTLITDAVELFRATNRAVNPVETSLSPTAPIRANQGAIQQIVLNLLQNAADASAPGRPIRVVTRQDGATPILEVVDQGSGIPPEVLRRMYEPLFTTKAEGTGLGLSIVKRIADEHGATLECDTQVGRGTTFRVRFPAR